VAGEQLQRHCRVCRLVLLPGEATVFSAFGKPLFAVHRNGCAEIIRGGVRTVGKISLVGAELILRARAPKVLEGVKALAAVAGKIKGQMP